MTIINATINHANLVEIFDFIKKNSVEFSEAILIYSEKIKGRLTSLSFEVFTYTNFYEKIDIW